MESGFIAFSTFIFYLFQFIWFLVGSSLSSSLSERLMGILLDTIEMPNEEGGRLNAYFYDIFTETWISQGMVLDVARLIKDHPDYKIYVINYTRAFIYLSIKKICP